MPRLGGPGGGDRGTVNIRDGEEVEVTFTYGDVGDSAAFKSGGGRISGGGQGGVHRQSRTFVAPITHIKIWTKTRNNSLCVCGIEIEDINGHYGLGTRTGDPHQETRRGDVVKSLTLYTGTFVDAIGVEVV